MHLFLGIMRAKKRPFKTTPYPLMYLIRDIYGFYNGPSPQYKIGGKNILVIMDRLSKGIILIPILLIFTPAVATTFIERYIPYHGLVKAIVNNKGT